MEGGLTSGLGVLSSNRAGEVCASWRKAGLKIVFTNGVFDLLHAGHIDYLQKAAKLGHRLVVGLNADNSVKTLDKGPARPIKDQNTRALILGALRCVDAVVLFEEETPLQLIQTLKPDILVKGGDYDPNCHDVGHPKYIVGSDFVMEQGGKVAVIPFLQGHSTTALEKKILKAHGIDVKD
jgi:rfaE bifunctional protein nucleotidyltransferase chain/domain